MTWTWPVADPVVVTSPFNLLRVHPVTGKVTPHTGTDFRARQGTDLYAANGGTVVRALRNDPRAGNYVRVQVDAQTWIGYSHLSALGVKVGQVVRAGQVIGQAGATGLATAAHLHFEVCTGGVKVDPVPYLSQRINPPPRPDQPATPATLEDAPMFVALNIAGGPGALIYPSGKWAFVTNGPVDLPAFEKAGIPTVVLSTDTYKNLTDPHARVGA